MSDTTGGSQDFHNGAIEQVTSGGATVRLMAETVDYADTQTELDNKELSGTGYSAQTVAEADWNVSFDNATRTATLENADVVDFGETATDWGVVEEVVIDADDGSDIYLLADEPNKPDLTGEDYRFPIGEITYTLGDA